jgi:Na+/H+ antiporter NhaD/arsenite permease-like protein
VVIFFIFSVSNIGGCLTPLGDPPLFLGYLNGVPFTWTFRLFPEWLLTNGILLILFYIFDTLKFKKEPIIEAPHIKQPLSAVGLINILWLLGVVFAVAFIQIPFPHCETLGYREIALLMLVGISLITTQKGLREENKFTYNPVIEVGFLFLGIFLTMIPALVYLETHGPALVEKGLTKPWMFFWFSGSLSSFLDNAPTYLTFFTLAKGMKMAGDTVAATGVTVALLKAISLGSVFMGANTYIGNGPNFMVKAIADETGTKMPSFVGYMKWSGLILIPVFIFITFVVFIWGLL